MSKKVKVWVDSGANIHSRNENEMTEDDFGMTEEEWNDLPEEEKFSTVLEFCYGFDWGVKFVSE